MNMKGKIILLMILWIPIHVISAVLPRHFKNDVSEGQWFFKGNRLQCELHQSISGFGEVFVGHPHTKLAKMILMGWISVAKDQQAVIKIFKPHWQQIPVKLKYLSKAPIEQKNITLNPKLTQSILAHLAQGYTVRFEFNSNMRHKICVDLSSRYFQTEYRSFTQCGRHLIHFNLAEVKHTTIYFSVNQIRLTKTDLKRISKVRAYVLADKRIKKIVIRGFSDSQGRRGHNNYLSELRAKAVYRVLMAGGELNKNRVKLTWYGERYPIESNQTDIGQALNRRVTIDLYSNYP